MRKEIFGFENRIRESFARQTFMRTLGAELLDVLPGCVSISLPFSESLVQQDGFIHAGAITSIADSACGYAAMTQMEPGERVLSVEFKINMLKPAVGERFVAKGVVSRAGQTICVCEAAVHAVTGDERFPIARMLGTMIRVKDEGTAG